jgi:hypothetical protein
MPDPFYKRLPRFLEEEVRPYINSSNRKSLATQFSDMVGLFKYYKFIPYQYFRHNLYDRSFSGDVYDYLPPMLISRYIRNNLNPAHSDYLARDKYKFSKILCANNIPVITNLFIITADFKIISAENEKQINYIQFINFLFENGYKDVFIKPRYGEQGKGTIKINLFENDSVYNQNLIDQQQCGQLLGGKDTYLVQPAIKQHSTLNKIYPDAVNTIRIDALLSNSRVEHNGAFLKVGNGRSYTDNWSNGSLIININLTSGKLDSWGKMMGKFGKCVYTRHPATDFEFKDTEIPFWDQVKETVRRAALHMKPLRALGWDITVTDQGPLIVEANQEYAIDMHQEAIGGFRHKPIGRMLLE